MANWASEQAKLIANHITTPFLRFTCGSLVAAYGGDPGRLPIAFNDDGFFDREELSFWEDAPSEVAVAVLDHGDLSDPELTLHPHVLGIYEPNSMYSVSKYKTDIRVQIIKSLAQAWGCSPEAVQLDHEFEYEIGFHGDRPYYAYNVIVIRRP